MSAESSLQPISKHFHLYTLYTLPETSKFAPEKRPSQKETIVFQPSIFRCQLAVSFREGKPLNHIWQRELSMKLQVKIVSNRQ